MVDVVEVGSKLLPVEVIRPGLICVAGSLVGWGSRNGRLFGSVFCSQGRRAGARLGRVARSLG